MNEAAVPRDIDPVQLWRDALVWLDEHTMRILIAGLAGLLIVGALYGARLFGRRLGRSAHPWWSVIGRALAFILFPLIVALYMLLPKNAALIASWRGGHTLRHEV